jgi:signal transduction histidine kinase
MASGGRATGNDSAHLLVAAVDPTRCGEIVELLETRGYRTSRPVTAADAMKTLNEHRTGVVIAFDEGGVSGRPGFVGAVCAAAFGIGVPVLMVVDDLSDSPALAARLADVDDWVSAPCAVAEIPVRVARLLRRSRLDAGLETPAGGTLAVGPRLLSLVVHDLRTPLNVIGLSLRVLAQTLPRTDPEIDEDLRFMEENFQLMVSMLHQLSDFHRLNQPTPQFDPVTFDPRRLADDLVAELESKAGPHSSRVTLQVDPSCPPEVTLDPLRAKQALQYAVANASHAARAGGIVRVVLRGSDGKWVTEIAVDRPPPPTVRPVTLSPNRFERTCGAEAERRGMDLAIAARVSELFGGSARLDVREGQGTSVILDWPVGLP